MKIKVLLDFDDTFGKPQIDILVDEYTYYSGDVQREIELNIDCNQGDHQFKIIHRNKAVTDFNQEHDKHVVIEKIFFDEIDLDQLENCRLTHAGKFYPEYNKDYIETWKKQGVVLPEFISPNHYLGHNGIWVLDFEYPALNWIIKIQNPAGINLEDTMFSTGDIVLLEIKEIFNL